MAEQNLETEVNNLLTWSNKTSLVFNSPKTKLIAITSKQMTRVHNLDD